MPRGDRTGPLGMGVATGRRAGYCAGNDRPGFDNPIPGRGFGMGGGRGRGSWNRGVGGSGGGRGWRNMYYATGVQGWKRFGGYAAPAPNLDANAEKRGLQNRADALQAELEDIKRRLAEWETATKEA